MSRANLQPQAPLGAFFTPPTMSLTAIEWDLLKNQLDQLIQGQANIIARLDHLDECVDGSKVAIAELGTKIVEGFPDGDLDGHRAYHIGEMNKWTWWGNVKSSVLIKVLEYMAIGGAGWLAVTVWGGFKVSVAT